MGYGYRTKIIFSGLSVLSFGSFFRGEGEAGASYDASGKKVGRLSGDWEGRVSGRIVRIPALRRKMF